MARSSARAGAVYGRLGPPKSANERSVSSCGSMWAYWRSVSSGLLCPSWAGDPPKALPGGKGAGGIGMSRAVEAEPPNPLSITPESLFDLYRTWPRV